MTPCGLRVGSWSWCLSRLEPPLKQCSLVELLTQNFSNNFFSKIKLCWGPSKGSLGTFNYDSSKVTNSGHVCSAFLVFGFFFFNWQLVYFNSHIMVIKGGYIVIFLMYIHSLHCSLSAPHLLWTILRVSLFCFHTRIRNTSTIFTLLDPLCFPPSQKEPILPSVLHVFFKVYIVVLGKDHVVLEDFVVSLFIKFCHSSSYVGVINYWLEYSLNCLLMYCRIWKVNSVLVQKLYTKSLFKWV
jgi:hypothetical protein